MTTTRNITPFAEFLGQALYQYTVIRPLIPTFAHIVVSAFFLIYVGSHASLSRPSSAAAAKSSKKPKIEDGSEDWESDEDGESPLQKVQGLQPSDALVFPLMAAIVLGSLYLVIKWLEDPAILSKALNVYYSQIGVFLAAAFLKDGLSILRSFIFPRRYRHRDKTWQVKQAERIFVSAKDVNNSSISDVQVRHSPLPGFFGLAPLPKWFLRGFWSCRGFVYQKFGLRLRVRGLLDFSTPFSLLDIAAGTLALLAVIYFAFVAKPWWLINLLGFSFCYGALQLMSPSTFWTGSLILGSLFLYDIYFVFFTPLMVTVATKLDVPMKLLFPRPPHEGEDAVSLAMLGLGDIAIPGLMIGLALRFDLFLYYKRKAIQKAKAAGGSDEVIKLQYQSATGGWGERFWAPSFPSREPELDPPYHDARSFPKTYFHSSLIGYTIGLIVTLFVMHYSNHAQPALLYLVPGVLISLWSTALIKGDLDSMWAFSDSDEDNEDHNKDEASFFRISQSLFGQLWAEGAEPLIPVSRKNERKGAEAEEKAKGSPDSPATLTERNSSEALAVEKTNEVTRHHISKRSITSHRRGRNDQDDEDSDLISFSISLPRRRASRRRKGLVAGETPGKLLLTERDGEPPVKKRRPSPTSSS
jgi:minor histocompatibility antigen H13